MTDIFTKLTELRDAAREESFTLNVGANNLAFATFAQAFYYAFDTLKAHHEAAERLAEAVKNMDGFKFSEAGNLITQQWPDWKMQRDAALEAYRNAIK